MAAPGSTAYYALPLAERLKDLKDAQAATGNQAVTTAYLRPNEAAYLQNVSISHEAWVDQVKKQYPSYISYLSVPEISQVLRDAVDNKHSPDETASALHATTWWQTHTPTQRSWYLDNATDPGQALQSVQQQFQEVMHQAGMYGIKLSTADGMNIATQALANGWNAQKLNETLVNHDPTVPTTGTLGAMRDTLKGQARNQVVPISGEALDGWTKKVVSGQASQDAFNDYVMHQAMSHYQDPGIRDALQRGVTVREYADGYLQTAAQTLGVNAQDIDLQDPKWNQALNFWDGKQHRAMTLSEWGSHIRTDGRYGYDSSENGKKEAATFVTGLRQQFGYA